MITADIDAFSDPKESIAQSMGKALAADYDQIIMETSGLNRREVVTNIRRFSSTIYPDGVEEIAIDGVPFVRLWPVEFAVALEDNKHTMKCTRRYQKIEKEE